MNKVLLTGRLTRDPELRALASGSSVATFAVATNEFRGNGKERAEFHNVVAISVEMLSGRRKRDYEADSLAAQAEDGATTTDDSAISPNEAAEVGVSVAAATADDEEGAAEDDQVLVLA